FAPETESVVVIDHAGRLHESVANGRTHEFESAADQVFAHGVRLGGARRRMGAIATMLQIAFAGELPDISIEAAEFFLHGKKCFGVRNGGFDFQTIANDSWIGQQSSHARRTITGDAHSVEVIERAAVIFAL